MGRWFERIVDKADRRAAGCSSRKRTWRLEACWPGPRNKVGLAWSAAFLAPSFGRPGPWPRSPPRSALKKAGWRSGILFGDLGKEGRKKVILGCAGRSASTNPRRNERESRLHRYYRCMCLASPLPAADRPRRCCRGVPPANAGGPRSRPPAACTSPLVPARRSLRVRGPAAPPAVSQRQMPARGYWMPGARAWRAAAAHGDTDCAGKCEHALADLGRLGSLRPSIASSLTDRGPT